VCACVFHAHTGVQHNNVHRASCLHVYVHARVGVCVSPLPHLRWDWTRRCDRCSSAALTATTSAPGPCSPQPHLRWGSAHLRAAALRSRIELWIGSGRLRPFGCGLLGLPPARLALLGCRLPLPRKPPLRRRQRGRAAAAASGAVLRSCAAVIGAGAGRRRLPFRGACGRREVARGTQRRSNPVLMRGRVDAEVVEDLRLCIRCARSRGMEWNGTRTVCTAKKNQPNARAADRPKGRRSAGRPVLRKERGLGFGTRWRRRIKGGGDNRPNVPQRGTAARASPRPGADVAAGEPQSRCRCGSG
jgi:hypothetical protein